NSKSIPEGKEALMSRFGLDDVQAQAIVQMRLGQLTGLERIKIEEELDELKKKIAEYLDILANHSRVLEIIKTEAIEIKEKFADERRTEIMNVSGEVDIEDLIPEETCVYTLTDFGYIKRMPADTYQIQNRGGKGIKGLTRREEDFVSTMFTASTHDMIAFFTTKGRTYRLKGYEIPEASRNSRGINIINILPIENDERISAMIRIPENDDGKYLCMVTRKGIIKRSSSELYRNIRKTGVIAINLDDDDELAWVRMTDGDDKLVVATKKGMAICFNENDARPIGRTARGVKAIELRDGDEVVGMTVARDDKMLLTVSETGYGRRSPFDNYRVQSRGGKGLINYHTETYGDVAAIADISDEDDIILIASDGIIIRIAADSISTFARPSKGVRVMKVTQGEKLVTLTTAEKEEDDGQEDTQNQPDTAEDSDESAGTQQTQEG
ncbi:MAG: DNA gyrase C-terminal beta-propeller domain-containing protein, partial [Acutalibacteraceae bacterium]